MLLDKLVSSIDVAGILLFFGIHKSHVIQNRLQRFILMFSQRSNVDAKQLSKTARRYLLNDVCCAVNNGTVKESSIQRYHILIRMADIEIPFLLLNSSSLPARKSLSDSPLNSLSITSSCQVHIFTGKISKGSRLI
jgi:hypothetical protein